MLIITFIKIVILLIFLFIYKYTTNRYIYNILTYLININGIFIIKLFQWLSTRPDVIDDKFIAICNKFKKTCNIHDFEHTEMLLSKADIKYHIDNPIPIASGSVAQVYTGTFDNKNVVYKVKHPNIGDNLDDYIIIFKYIVKIFNIKISIEEFYNDLKNQINFLNEKTNSLKMEKIFKNDEHAKIPELLYGNEDILIYEHISSIEISEYFSYIDFYDKRKMIINTIYSMLKPIFVDNIFHADFHEGNWGYTNDKIIIYDFGHLGCFDKNIVVEFMKSLSTHDTHSFIYILLNYINVDFSENIDNVNLFNIGNTKENGLNMVKTVFELLKKYNVHISSDLINLIFLIQILDNYKITYSVSNYYKNCDIMFKELLKISSDDKLIDIYSEILKYLKDYRIINKKVRKVINKCRKSLLYLNISDEIENMILSMINILHIKKYNSIQIMHLIYYMESNMKNKTVIKYVNNFINNSNNFKLHTVLNLFNHIVNNINIDDIDDLINKL